MQYTKITVFLFVCLDRKGKVCTKKDSIIYAIPKNVKFVIWLEIPNRSALNPISMDKGTYYMCLVGPSLNAMGGTKITVV